jgi:hypothetical protein
MLRNRYEGRTVALPTGELRITVATARRDMDEAAICLLRELLNAAA